jgi:tyrosinase
LDKLSKIFAHQTTMNNFSTALEELHGWIHYNIAGAPDTDRIHPKKFAGHMLPTEYSAFDPIFWLHHW